MNPTRRSFLTRIFAGAVAAPALTRIIAESTKQKNKFNVMTQGTTHTVLQFWASEIREYHGDFGTVKVIHWPNL